VTTDKAFVSMFIGMIPRQEPVNSAIVDSEPIKVEI